MINIEVQSSEPVRSRAMLGRRRGQQVPMNRWEDEGLAALTLSALVNSWLGRNVFARRNKERSNKDHTCNEQIGLMGMQPIFVTTQHTIR